MPLSRSDLEILDRDDALASHRAKFVLPEGVAYFDGNSLGAMPRGAAARLREVAEREWAEGLIRSWNRAGWIDLPRRVGDKIARLIGAKSGEVIVTDSTSVNLFKVLAAALALRPERRTILSDLGNFPSDLYIAEGLRTLLGAQHRLHLVDPMSVAKAIDDHVAVVMLTEIDYRNGLRHDMKAITAAAHARGALVIWDLSHSAGALPVDLNAARADLAIGCGYKFLNGGPGAPAFVFVAERHHDAAMQPLSGWLGHAAPFAFETGYRPAPGITRFVCGTPPILSLASLDCGVDSFADVDMHALHAKSMRLGDLFIRLVEERCAGLDVSLACPREGTRRGSQVSFAHPEGYAVMQAMIARGVIGDFRTPDIMRFGIAPLYLRHVDMWDAVEAMREVLATRIWDQPRFKQRAAVT